LILARALFFLHFRFNLSSGTIQVSHQVLTKKFSDGDKEEGA
jgi:hypothetical protein